MTDKELLELAAKAAGIRGGYLFRAGGTSGSGLPYNIFGIQQVGGAMWNPLTDDGDAMRLAVKLGFMTNGVGFARYLSELQQMFDVDMKPSEAARRAIVRAAAEIGKELK